MISLAILAGLALAARGIALEARRPLLVFFADRATTLLTVALILMTASTLGASSLTRPQQWLLYLAFMAAVWAAARLTRTFIVPKGRSDG